MYTLQLRDGRTLGYMRYGTPGGRPVFYFHGVPGSRCEGLLLDEPARALNVQVVAVDRPGYGLSSLQPGRVERADSEHQGGVAPGAERCGARPAGAGRGVGISTAEHPQVCSYLARRGGQRSSPYSL